MNSSPSRTVTTGKVLSAEHAASLPVASLLSLQSASALLGIADDRVDEDAIEARVRAAYQQGLEEGNAQARSAIQLAREQTLDLCRKQLTAALSELLAQRDSMLKQLAADSIELTFGLLHQLVGAELALRESAAREAVLRALEIAPPEVDLIVRVHPSSELASDEFTALFPASSITIMHDPAVEPTGAIVDAGPCRIDAQIGPALERVRSVLEAGVGLGPSGE